jgi:hypothetical protein
VKELPEATIIEGVATGRLMQHIRDGADVFPFLYYQRVFIQGYIALSVPLVMAVKSEIADGYVYIRRHLVLFETPVAHFLVRAFLAEGVDEFLAHITTIEAALGLRADYQKNFRVAPDRHKGMRATNRMRGRIAGLLGDRRYANQYERLFDKRSAFLHGRAMTAISTEERVMARSLAREVVQALILATQSGPISSREDFLDGLLDKGAPLI